MAFGQCDVDTKPRLPGDPGHRASFRIGPAAGGRLVGFGPGKDLARGQAGPAPRSVWTTVFDEQFRQRGPHR